jgi:exonuclease SbcC
MVPLRLSIRNFLCYAENCPELDLSDIGVACLCGDNGHGKSALLDAITWSVWGAARARTEDELIHSGRVDMEVQFEFRVGDVRYRVLRKRRRGTANSPGRVLLEFHVCSGDVWKPLTGGSARETQQRIVEAVRLDYDTFRNSAFLMQGRADEFTVKAPGERKKVLAEILGLGAYDVYEARSKDERRSWEAESKRLDAQIAQFAAELAREPTYLRERDEVRDELRGVESELKDKSAIADGLRKLEQSVKLLKEQARAAARDREEARSRVDRAEAELRNQQAIIDARTALLGRAEHIRAGALRLKQARAVESDQSVRLATVAKLEREQAAARTEIEREASRLRSLEERLRPEVSRLESLAEKLNDARSRRSALEVDRQELDGLEKHLASLRQELQEEHNVDGQLLEANKRLREEMEELKRKQLELDHGEGSVCPICRTELGPEGKKRAHEAYELEGSEKARQFKGNASRRREVEARTNALQAEVKQAESATTARQAKRQRELAIVDREEQEGAEAADRLPELRRSLSDATSKLRSNDFAVEARGRLAEAEKVIEATAYDADAHAAARTRVKALASAESELLELSRAEEAVQAAGKAIERARQDLEDWSKALARFEQRQREVEAELAAQPDPTERLLSLADEITALELRGGSVRLALGAAEQKLDDCRRFRRQHDHLQGQLAEAKLKQRIYEELATAFGRKGVQALIIDSVIPEIEDEANRLLARMSNGRMSVALSTQRSTQKGLPVETLDISISDELGTRAYELFSGGEAFRINLALRIALSKLLARRAGAPLPTLIVDEGFGTQDASGRERLLEAMNAVARDFECLIIITHLNELKDQFERQIRVEKTPHGSIARVV